MFINPLIMKCFNVFRLCVSVCALWACTDIEHIDTPSPGQKVCVLFAPNGLGDNGYNDQILRGVVQFANNGEFANVEVDYYNPMSLNDGVRIIDEWCDTTLEKKNSLLVLASAVYKDTLTSRLQRKPLDTSCRQVLMFETDEVNLLGVTTFNMSMYGVAYMAGAVANEMRSKPLIALANREDEVMTVVADGFKAGFNAYNDEKRAVDAVYLSDAGDGYAMADSVYRLMHDWSMHYSFIFPVMGGSNMGVFRYLREYPHGVSTVGTDVDQSHLCNPMVGCMVKHIDWVVEEYLERWTAGEELPKHVLYGLESGYVDWVPSYNFEGVFDETLIRARMEAIEKERNYGME